jgi:predicted nuclease of predicted toxin-antitoxin system
MKLKSIQILTDENISPKVVKSLRDQGLDVLDIKEEGWYGKEDQEILDIAFREKRFILSHDSDFGTLAINEGKRFFGILYLRLNDLKPENVVRVCTKLFGQDVDIFPGAIVVIEETRIRMRSSEVEPI